MDRTGCFALNSWLQKADNNYIEGRALWFHFMFDGSCNLLWLASEQMMKILLLQKDFQHTSFDGQDVDLILSQFDRAARNFGHNLERLLVRFDEVYPEVNIRQFQWVLGKVQEYFYRRYVVNETTEIGLALINSIDQCYFELRSKVLPEVGLGLVDELRIDQKYNRPHGFSAFQYAYFRNSSFRGRRHSPLNLLIDGEVVCETGE